MSKVKIVTDSTSDLSLDLAKSLNIEIVPLSITIDNQTYLDRVDISPKEFIEKMKNSEELPKSSQPAVGQFVEVYDRLGQDGSEIISIHMTSGMSGTVSSAESAAQITETKVTVIDSKFISKALSYQVLEANRMAEDGFSSREIIKKIDEIRDNTYLFVVVDKLDNLVKGGRIGRGKAMIGSLLNIKPIASLADGVYTPTAKVRSQSQIVKYLTNQFSEDTKGKVIKAVSIVHAEAYELASKVKESIFDLTGFNDITIEYTTPVISTHTGEGAIGFMYFAEGDNSQK
ncbi:DegV family protein [Litchfieldia salsa]|uniref:EDD domain protein, DegV family n=1 Tax=Litchfieldia salsa TaxID=930152 RepID=A0A1H0TGU8_9BACI|nr:DegV family protein [Litchfieldia salsa]SDP52910.1 EDD domain protein, DegV family [Litchfieldia salsa]